MTHEICDACETVAHCMKNGCVPIQAAPESTKRRVSNSDFRELLNYYPRLKSFYEIGPLQRCELEAFVNSALQADMVGVTADGELVQAGDTVYVLSSTGKIESATVEEPEVVTDYYLYTNVPVSSSFSSKQAAQTYKDTAL